MKNKIDLNKNKGLPIIGLDKLGLDFSEGRHIVIGGGAGVGKSNLALRLLTAAIEAKNHHQMVVADVEAHLPPIIERKQGSIVNGRHRALAIAGLAESYSSVLDKIALPDDNYIPQNMGDSSAASAKKLSKNAQKKKKSKRRKAKAARKKHK